MKKKYKAVIIGCGRMAGSDDDLSSSIPTSHAGMFKHDDRFELVAVCDLDEQRRKEFQSKWNVDLGFADLGTLLSNVRPDVVSIVTPTQDHVASTLSLGEASIPVVFLEKPVAGTAIEAGLLSEIDQKKTRVLVNYQRRFSSNFRSLKHYISDNKLGKITHVQSAYPIGLIHAGTHALDLMLWLFGDPLSNQANFLRADFGHDALVDFALLFSGDILAHVQGVAREPANLFEIDILGTKGRVRFTLGGRHLEALEPESDPVYPHLFTLTSTTQPFKNQWEDTYTNAADHIVELIEHPDIVPECSLADGTKALALAEELIAKARRLKVPHNVE